jgi:hypothetical protein
MIFITVLVANRTRTLKKVLSLVFGRPAVRYIGGMGSDPIQQVAWGEIHIGYYGFKQSAMGWIRSDRYVRSQPVRGSEDVWRQYAASDQDMSLVIDLETDDRERDVCDWCKLRYQHTREVHETAKGSIPIKQGKEVAMDYRKLLKKYMEHVGEIEGTYYLGRADRLCGFTDEEWAELHRLSKEEPSRD